MAHPVRIGPLTAICLLQLHCEKKYTLGLSEYEELVDIVVELLEKVNNEKYRMKEDAPIG